MHREAELYFLFTCMQIVHSRIHETSCMVMYKNADEDRVRNERS